MICPKCDGKLKAMDLEPDLQVDRCESCKGIWMDKGELARFANTTKDLPGNILEGATISGLNCPSCHEKKHTSGLYQASLTPRLSLETCRSCEGLWFDNKELSALQNHLKELRIQAKLNRVNKK
jgi:Zn-finger nucleic acid-binding protein